MKAPLEHAWSLTKYNQSNLVYIITLLNRIPTYVLRFEFELVQVDRVHASYLIKQTI